MADTMRDDELNGERKEEKERLEKKKQREICNRNRYTYRFSHFRNIPNPVLIVFQVNLSAEEIIFVCFLSLSLTFLHSMEIFLRF